GQYVVSAKRMPMPASRSALMSSGTRDADCRRRVRYADSYTFDSDHMTPPTCCSRTSRSSRWYADDVSFRKIPRAEGTKSWPTFSSRERSRTRGVVAHAVNRRRQTDPKTRKTANYKNLDSPGFTHVAFR